MTLAEVRQNAIDTLNENVEYRGDDFNPDELDDVLAEAADSSIPVYTYDLLQLAADNLFLATTEPGMGSDGTVVGILQANIYEYLVEELAGVAEGIRQEIEGAEGD